ncbi:MAG TPA: endonuclease/exonuclease/phosphatase family protein [Terriglobia bacterium]|nr:endonuclease/exonuclease/phosphatase family protein [Terriglobia bacterium]
MNRRSFRTTHVLVTVLLMLAALTPPGYSAPAHTLNGPGGQRDIDIATINLYTGADFGAIATLDPGDPLFGPKLLAAIAEIHGRIVASNFPKRAEALAAEIVERGPDLIALQEVTLLRRQSPGDFVVGGMIPATDVELDYLAILLGALERHGGHYAVVSLVNDIDVEVPLATSFTTFDDVRLTDRDVILARTDLPPGFLRVSNPLGANYAAAVPLPIGVDVARGWCSIDVWERGRQFRLINTHLEGALPAPLPNIQGLQAAELLLVPAATALPVILAGDFNSDANGLYSPGTYALLVGAGGFSDAWRAVHPGDPGLTWGHDEFLSDPFTPFTLRIDLVLYRGRIFSATDAEVVDPVIDGYPPLWFSDHAALFSGLAVH